MGGIVQTVETDLGKVAHAFASGAKVLKSEIILAETKLSGSVGTDIATAEKIANAVAEQIYPGSAIVLTAIEKGMASLFNAIDTAADAAQANGLNISLDVATVAAIKAALPIVKTQALTTPGS